MDGAAVHAIERALRQAETPFTAAAPATGARILAEHLTELRGAIAGAYAANGIAVPAWTHVVAPGARIEAADIIQLRAALR